MSNNTLGIYKVNVVMALRFKRVVQTKSRLSLDQIIKPQVSTSKSLNHIQNKQGDAQCLVCKSYSNKVIYVCESGYFLCKTCKSIDHGECVQDTPGNKIQACDSQRTSSIQFSSKNKKSLKGCEFGSGDNDKINASHENLKLRKQECFSYSTHHLKPTSSSHISGRIHDENDKNTKTIIEYKNNDYKESTSSIESISMSIAKNRNETISENNCISKSLARPVLCPVTTCSKMLAIDATLQHFCFDHSKVPKILLKPRKSQRLVQKSTVFTKDTQCIAIVACETRQEIFCQRNLLLMCATISPNKNNRANIINKYQNETAQSENKKNGSVNITHTKRYFGNDEVILIWLCKIDDNTCSYKLTLSRKDKLLSYAFTGDAIHVRDKHDAHSVYDKSNCLVVKGCAANRILDEHSQFHIFISNV